jgi:tape measure domain-containing protein
MSEDLQKLLIRIEADTTRLQRNLTNASKLVDGKLKGIDQSLSRSDKRFSQWGSNIKNVVGIGVAYSVARAGKAALIASDQIDVMKDRIMDATKESGDFDKVWQGIMKTAVETGSDMGANIELVQRLSIASKDLGSTSDDVLKLNNIVQKLGIIGGSSMEGLKNGTVQLAQGLGEGIFRAQEFNSVLENIPAVANAIAKSLGKSTAELRSMVKSGTLTSKEVFQALLDSGDDVEERFEKIPPRLERSWNSFLTAITLMISDFNNELGITEILAQSLTNLTTMMAPPDFSAMPGGQKYNELLDERYAILEKISKFAPTSGFWHNKWIADLKEVDEELSNITKKTTDTQSKIKTIEGNPFVDLKSNDPMAKRLKIDKPDQPKILNDELTESINKLIAASAMEEQQVGMTESAIARLNAETEILNDLKKRGASSTPEQIAQLKIMLDAYEKQVQATVDVTKVFEDGQEALKKSQKDQEDALKAHFKKLDDMANGFAEDFGDIFINTVSNGGNPFEALATSFKNTLIKMAADALFINPLRNLLSPGGGNLLGSIGSGISKIFGFADGGSPPVGQVSMVGERGPELFVPKAAGTIIPNHKMGGGQVVNISVDARGATDPAMVRHQVNQGILQAAPSLIAASENRTLTNARRPRMA